MSLEETVRSSTRERQIERLAAAVDGFRGAVLAIDASALAEPLGNWTPRDIVAHLIGWNDAIIEGCGQLLRGELPFYDHDPGEDYCNVNDRFLREHAANDRRELLGNLTASAGRLSRFLATLEPRDWDRDSGVMHGDERLTVRDTVDDLIDDYAHHTRQLTAWTAPGLHSQNGVKPTH